MKLESWTAHHMALCVPYNVSNVHIEFVMKIIHIAYVGHPVLLKIIGVEFYFQKMLK